MMTEMWCGGRNSISIELKKRKIMRIQSYLLPMIISLGLCFASCSNENEEWEYDYESDTWETELRNVVSDFNFLFENSFVKFLQAEELNCKVDSSDFLNDETYYPVCIKNLYNFFMPKKLTFVMNDTSTIHMPYSAIRGMISNIIDNQDKYDFVKLTWLYSENKFMTIAVFDKSNGQIVYDNFLTNIPLFQMELPTKKSYLTRAEGGGGGHVETRVFYKDKLTVPNGGYYFDYRIKCFCNVICSDYGNPILVLDFETIEDQLTCPQYPQNMFYPVADFVIYNGCIIYYLWLGIGIDDFSLYYNYNNPGENAYELYQDIKDHRWLPSKSNAKSVGFYSSLNAGSYQTDPGWDF